MKKKIIIIVISVIVVGGIIAKLYTNKKAIDAETKPKELNINVPVVVDTVAEATLDNDFSVTGSFEPAHQVMIVSETQGKLVSVQFENGDFVREGQMLASCDLELLNAQKRLAEASLEKSRSDLKKYEEMFNSNAVSKQDVENLRLAFINAETNLVTVKKQIEYSVIRAPFSGYITRKLIDRGAMLLPGTPVAEIIDITNLKFIANVSESNIPLVHKGQDVKVTADIFGGVDFPGTVRSVSVKADDAKRFPVEIVVKNQNLKTIRSGMFGTAWWQVEGTHRGLVIPRAALVGSIRDPKVFIIENGKAKMCSVILGAVTEQTAEVLSGLTAGQLVVKAGQINLENNTAVRITNK